MSVADDPVQPFKEGRDGPVEQESGQEGWPCRRGGMGQPLERQVEGGGKARRVQGPESGKGQAQYQVKALSDEFHA